MIKYTVVCCRRRGGSARRYDVNDIIKYLHGTRERERGEVM